VNNEILKAEEIEAEINKNLEEVED